VSYLLHSLWMLIFFVNGATRISSYTLPTPAGADHQ
jgi:hypothetical protein